MIKKILAVVIGFALGLGVTTYVMVKNHNSAPVPAGAHPADSTKATDSSAVAAVDTAARNGSHAPADSAKPTKDSTVTPVTTPVIPQPITPATAASAAHAAGSTVDPAAKAAAYKSVARIFASMKPTDAAQVLALLNDTEVEGILRAVAPKQAADFLSNLPKERAAALSRRLLVPKPDSGVGK